MNARTEPEAHAFQEAYAKIIEDTPTAPSWHDLLEQETRRGDILRPWFRRPLAVASAAAMLVAFLIGGLVLVQPFGTSEDAPFVDEARVTTIGETHVTNASPVPVTATLSTTSAEVAEATSGPAPDLGEGWETLLSTGPDDSVRLEDANVAAGRVYLTLLENGTPFSATLDLDADDIQLNRLDVPGGLEFVDGGPGVVAWAPDGRLWASADGLRFEPVGEDLLAGCGASPSGCEGSELYSITSSPSGTVVALAMDPLVWDAECECFHLNPVALVSADGYQWTRHPLDLTALLPEKWGGSADISSPLAYLDGRFVTYATHYSDDCNCTSAAYFASENGSDWYAVDTGILFEERYLHGMAANANGIVAVGTREIYSTPDGLSWTAVQPTGYGYPHEVAAYEGGFVVVTYRSLSEMTVDTIWHSFDGIAWSSMALDLGVEVFHFDLVSDGPDLMAQVASDFNVWSLWGWSG